MSDISDAYNREIKRRSGPFGLDKATTRIGAAAQLPLYATEGIGRFGSYLIDDLPEDATDLIFGASQGVADYLLGPSRYQRNLQAGNIPESELPLGTDLADIEGSGVGVPDFVPDDYSPGEIFSYDPTGEGLTKDIDAALKELYGDMTPGPRTRGGPAALRKVKEEQEAIQRAEDFRAAEKDIAVAQGMRLPQEKVDDAYISAMKDVIEASGRKDEPVKGETREEALARYKKEFSDITGIDSSGKVDKSQALMAFGLALMQNKAGKGFNLGNILQSVGEAGSAAMPELRKAQERADAAKLAAGKYALNQLAADRSAAAALAKEVREANRAFNLKMLELDIQAEKDARDDKKIRNIAKNKIIDGVEISYGTASQETKLARPSADAALLSNAWNKYSKGQENINKMLGIVEDLSQQNAPAFKTIGDRIKKQLGNYGLRDPKIDFGPEGASDEDKFNAMRLSVINEMKRLIIQESQVSDYDRKMLDASFGNVDLTTTPQQAEFALNEMLTYFNGKKQSLVPALQHMYDPTFYLTDGEYEKTKKYLSDALEVPFVPPQARNRDGSTTSTAVATVDLTGGQ